MGKSLDWAPIPHISYPHSPFLRPIFLIPSTYIPYSSDPHFSFLRPISSIISTHTPHFCNPRSPFFEPTCLIPQTHSPSPNYSHPHFPFLRPWPCPCPPLRHTYNTFPTNTPPPPPPPPTCSTLWPSEPLSPRICEHLTCHSNLHVNLRLRATLMPSGVPPPGCSSHGNYTIMLTKVRRPRQPVSPSLRGSRQPGFDIKRPNDSK